jgi:hypothetical protein
MRWHHRTRCRSRLLVPGVTPLLLLTLSTPLRGQARLSGQVLTSESRTPIAGAIVEIPSLHLSARSDSAGRFLIDGLASGDHQVIVRAVSFRPDTTWLDFRENEARSTDFLLSVSVTTLGGVRVTASEPEVRGRLAEFEERRRSGFGRFIDQSMIEANEHRRVADLISSNASGINPVRGRGAETWIAAQRAPTREAMRRSSIATMCYMDVWLDGVATPSIAAIEVYTGSSQVPPRFNKSGANCGVIVIWTR